MLHQLRHSDHPRHANRKVYMVRHTSHTEAFAIIITGDRRKICMEPLA